jgi:hypothetical protein
MYGDRPAGNAFRYVGDYQYRRVELADALEGALNPWWERLNASVEDIAASWTAIARALRDAGGSTQAR